MILKICSRQKHLKNMTTLEAFHRFPRKSLLRFVSYWLQIAISCKKNLMINIILIYYCISSWYNTAFNSQLNIFKHLLTGIKETCISFCLKRADLLSGNDPPTLFLPPTDNHIRFTAKHRRKERQLLSGFTC